MARAADTDYFHSFRFWAAAARAGGGNPLQAGEAGFSAVTIPEYTLEGVEYREGHYTFTRKFPGLITTADLTFSRGVVRGDTAFLAWLLQAGVGPGEYRADVTIWHFHRMANPPGPDLTSLGTMIPTGQQAVGPGRKYTVREAIPIRVKPAGDLESTSADVSIAEADVAYEFFNVEDF